MKRKTPKGFVRETVKVKPESKLMWIHCSPDFVKAARWCIVKFFGDGQAQFVRPRKWTGIVPESTFSECSQIPCGGLHERKPKPKPVLTGTFRLVSNTNTTADAVKTPKPPYTVERFKPLPPLGFSSAEAFGKYYFRIRARNGKIVAQSEGYSRKIDRDRTARHLVENLHLADTKDV